MGQPRSAMDLDDGDDVRAQLGPMTALLFVVPPGAGVERAARRLNVELQPVRERAREALCAEPRNLRSSPALRYPLTRCWELVDTAAVVIDAENWLLRQRDTTRAWAERRVDRAHAAVQRSRGQSVRQ